MTLWGLFTGLSQTTPWALHARLKAAEDEIRDLWEYTTNMGEDMSAAVDQLRTDLDAATSAVADRIDRILAGQDAAVVAKFQPVLNDLRALGADAANPVPEPAPEPAPSPDV